jgi:hypothetical protein
MALPDDVGYGYVTRAELEGILDAIWRSTNRL